MNKVVTRDAKGLTPETLQAIILEETGKDAANAAKFLSARLLDVNIRVSKPINKSLNSSTIASNVVLREEK